MPHRAERVREVATHVAFSARTAAEAVGHNKLRAGLTSLGILFGVASVIAMLAIGKGAEQEILEQMRLLGANNIVVTPIVEQKEGKVDKDDKKESKRFTPGLTYLDAESIARVIPDVGATSSEVVVNTVLTREGHHRSGKVVGVLEDRKVSAETAQRLGIRDANMDVYVPLPTMLLRFRNRAEVTQHEMELAAREFSQPDSSETDDQRAEKRNYHQLDKVVVQVDRAAAVPQVADIMRRLLTRRHNEVVDFEILVPELLLKQEQRTKTIFNIVLGAIASISLVVGGIGIMNIMLASILERIREIGVRRAVGATQKDVLAQFLSEAVMISLAGGVAGILTGAALSSIIEHAAKIHTIVSPLSIVVAFGVSVAVGLLFGIVPAWRAARQDPVVCLRYE